MSSACINSIIDSAINIQLRDVVFCLRKTLPGLLILSLFSFVEGSAQTVDQPEQAFVDRLLAAASDDQVISAAARDELSASWQLSYVAPLLETVSLTRNRRRVNQLFELLRANTG